MTSKATDDKVSKPSRLFQHFTATVTPCKKMSSINALLSKMGWDGRLAGHQLNDENKRLILEIINKEEELKQLDDKFEEDKFKNQFRSEYKKNIIQQLENTEALCRARESELEYDKCQTCLAERETGYLNKEIAEKEKDQRSLKERNIMLEKHIAEACKKLEQFQNYMKLDQQTLDAFVDELVQKEEDKMALIKYVRQDEPMIKSLMLDMEKLELEVMRKRKALNTEVMETKSAKIALAKTKDNLTKLHVEREQLIQQGDNTTKQMQQRGEETQQCMQEIFHAKQHMNGRKEILVEKKHLCETLRNNNKEAKRKLGLAELQNVKLHQELMKQENAGSNQQDELAAVRALHDRTDSEIKSKMARISTLKREKEDDTNKLQEASDFNAGLEDKLKVMTQTGSGEKIAEELKNFIDVQLAEIKVLDVQLNKSREVLDSYNELLQALKTKEKDSEAEILRNKSKLALMGNEHRKLEKHFQKQQRTATGQKATIDGLSKKLAVQQCADRSNEERILAMKITERSEVLEQKSKAAKMLANAVKETEDDTHFLRKELEKSDAQRRDLTDKVDELKVACVTNEKDMKTLRLLKQESLVDYNIMKLDVKRKRDLLYKKADNMMSLKKRKLDLQTVIKGRECECMFSRQYLKKQLKMAEQEKRTLSVELNEKLSKINVLKARFEVMNHLKADHEGEEQSFLADISEAVQEKEQLMRKRDHLYTEIGMVEQENQALKNTIDLFNESNSAFHRSLIKAKESSPECQEKLKMEEQLKAIEKLVKCKNRKIQDLQQKLQDMNDTSESLQQEVHVKKHELQLKELVITKLNKDISVQLEKIDRASKQCSKLTKKIHSTRNTETVNSELDVKLKMLRECMLNITEMLSKATKDNPDLKALLEERFKQAGVRVELRG